MYYLKVKQALESIYIIEDTMNIDILVSRYKFLLPILLELSSVKNTSSYELTVADGVEDYRMMYYDRTITDTQAAIVINPECLDNNEFYALNIVRCFHKYCDKMEQDLNNAKKEATKLKRREAVIESAKICIAELHSSKMTESIIYIAKDLERFDVHITFRTEDSDQPGERMNKEIAERLKQQEIVAVARS